jgi:hypothetical protein
MSKYASLLYAQPSFLDGIGRLVDAAGLFPATGASIAGATALALATSYLKALADHSKDLAAKKG